MWVCQSLKASGLLYTQTLAGVERTDLLASNLGLMVAQGNRPAQGKHHVVFGDKGCRNRIWIQIFGKKGMSPKDLLMPPAERDAEQRLHFKTEGMSSKKKKSPVYCGKWPSRRLRIYDLIVHSWMLLWPLQAV